MKLFTYALVAGLGVQFSTALLAQQFKVDKEKSSATFLAVGKPGFLRIEGKNAKPEGALEFKGGQVSGMLKIYLNDYVTGIEMRDKHMKETYLETQKYPYAELKLTNQPISLTSSVEQKLNGTIKLKETTRDETVTWIWKKLPAGTESEGEGKFSILLSNYKIDIPKYLGVKVADTVDVTVKLFTNK